MRYEYIVLRNFAAIEAVMKTQEIRIDFPKSETGIFLISGPNGSCKTFIQSSLHPFATNGSMDIRSEESLIVKGEEGYKELKIVNGTDEYVVKHFYSPSKERHSVKSYLSKNGVEMNENGNVGSFKELIEMEFGLTLDYMKLVRLGSNVTNFIDLKSTERKSFMGLILDETEIYLQHHKKVTMLLRDCKSVISHTSNRLAKLNINSVADMQATQHSLEGSLRQAQDDIEKITSQIAIIDHEISKLRTQTELEGIIHSAMIEMESIRKELNGKKFRKLAELPDDAPSTSQEIEKYLSENIAYLQSKEDMLKSHLTNMNYFIADKVEMEDRLRKVQSNSEVRELQIIVGELSKEVHSLEDKYKDVHPTCTLEEYREYMGFIRQTGDIISQMYSFGIDVIRNSIEIIKKNADIDSEVDKAISEIHHYKLSGSAKEVYMALAKEVKGFSDMKSKDDCKGCPYVKSIRTIEDFIDGPSDVPSHPEEFYEYVRVVSVGIKNMIVQFQSKKDLLERMPVKVQKSLTLENIFSRIYDLDPVYDLPLLLSEETIISGYENYVNKKSTLESKKKELIVKEARDDIPYLSNKVADLNDKIHREDVIVEELRKDISVLEEGIEFYKEFREIADRKNDLMESLNTLEKEVKDANFDLTALKESLSNRMNYTQKLDQIRFLADSTKNRIDDIKYRLLEYERLNADLNSLQERYDEIELTREALSSKEGIPMILIKKYLKSVHKITNELLDIAYGGSLKIKPFHITDSEFRIPYSVNGKTMSDVTHSSQGETSFITVALSFALMCRRIGKFNIMLLDEIDGPLDKMKRQKFIDVLLHQMEMVGSEQVFIISHNDMFDMYPVHVISTVPVEDKSTNMKRYIEIQKK